MLELLLLTAALSTDNFAVSIGYGSSNTKISSGMTVLLNVFCSAALVASAQFGKSFLQFAEPEWGTRVCAGCFFLMGSLQMLRELKKHRRKKQGRKEQGRKKQERKEEFPGTWEKQISALEFGLLAVSMSVDGVVSGIFILDLPVTGGQIFFTSFAVGMTAMYAGYAIGKRTGRKKGGSGAVMGGLLFYLLAVLKLKGQN
ncbi:manganese efflux pump MntP [Fusicatenibacter sp.]